MNLTRIACSHFRNLQQVELAVSPGISLFWGENGQGKTNLMEAVWMLTGAKSFRGSGEKQLIAFGSERAAVEGSFFSQGREQQIRREFGGKKQIALNFVPQPSAAALAGVFCCVVFSPSHLSLVQDGPEKRRRFLDTLLCQLYPGCIQLLLDYKKAVEQRNALLRDLPYHSDLAPMLDVFDQMTAAAGAQLTVQRGKMVEKLAVAAENIYKELTKEKEKLLVKYQPGFGGEITENIPSLTEQYLACLVKSRQEDIRYGYTTVGCHRDDLSYLVDGKAARLYASQGQQRSCVLATKLAECEIIAKVTGEEPVMILDDVLSELDPSRQRYILEQLDNRQVFITCCDPAVLEKKRAAHIFQVEAGKIVRA